MSFVNVLRGIGSLRHVQHDELTRQVHDFRCGDSSFLVSDAVTHRNRFSFVPLGQVPIVDSDKDGESTIRQRLLQTYHTDFKACRSLVLANTDEFALVPTPNTQFFAPKPPFCGRASYAYGCECWAWPWSLRKFIPLRKVWVITWTDIYMLIVGSTLEVMRTEKKQINQYRIQAQIWAVKCFH